MIRPELKKYYLYVFLSVAIVLAIQAALPFPYGFILSLSFMVAMPAIVRFYLTRSFRSKGAGFFGGLEGTRLRIICQVCGKETKERECPRCGSRQFHTR